MFILLLPTVLKNVNVLFQISSTHEEDMESEETKQYEKTVDIKGKELTGFSNVKSRSDLT